MAVEDAGAREGPGRRVVVGAIVVAVIAGLLGAVGIAWLLAENSSPRSGGPNAHTATVIPTPPPATSTAILPLIPATGASLERAGALLREGQFEAAIVEYDATAGNPATAAPERARAYIGASIARWNVDDGPGAIAAVRSGVAQAPAGSAEARDAAYLLGLRLNEAEQWPEAARVLAPLLTSVEADPLHPYIAAEYARAAAHAGNATAADGARAAVLADPGAPGSLKIAVLRDRANLARESGDLRALVAALSAAGALGAGAGVHYELALAAQELGDVTTFAAEMSVVVARYPSSDESLAALAALNAAGIATDSGAAGLAYYRRGAYTEAKATLEAAIANPDLSGTDRAFRTYYLAAAREDSGELDAAVIAYDAAAASAPGSVWAHRAKYWAARVTERLGDDTGASARYLAFAIEGPEGEFSEEVAFRAGYALLHAGNAASAVATWDTLDIGSNSRALFWKGKAQARLGNAEGARAAYQAAISADSLSFFGGEAARELGLKGPLDVRYRPLGEVGPPSWEGLAKWAGAEADLDLDVGVVATLALLGLHESSETILLDAARGATAPELLALAHVAYDADLRDVAARLAVRLRSVDGLGRAPSELMKLEYPLDYVVLLDAEARANDIDPLFFAAMVRQESFWDAGAGSHAGALGLTQVIPPTGEAIAQALGLPFSPDDLFRPAVSLKFGAFYLGGQLRRYGNAPAALSAYNAGPGNASRWQEAATGASAAEFVEVVDIDETYRYVQLVLEHYAHYAAAWRP